MLNNEEQQEKVWNEIASIPNAGELFLTLADRVEHKQVYSPEMDCAAENAVRQTYLSIAVKLMS